MRGKDFSAHRISAIHRSWGYVIVAEAYSEMSSITRVRLIGLSNHACTVLFDRLTMCAQGGNSANLELVGECPQAMQCNY